MTQHQAHRRHRRTPLFVTASLFLLMAAASVPARAASDVPAREPGSQPTAAQPTEAAAEKLGQEIEQAWGVKLVGLRHTASGYMLDLRFRVIDPEKAAPLLSRKIDRFVIVEKSGAILRVPSTEKLGQLRSAVSTPDMVKRDRVYAALFANPGRHVAPGDKVTLVLGDFRKPVTVE